MKNLFLSLALLATVVLSAQNMPKGDMNMDMDMEMAMKTQKSYKQYEMALDMLGKDLSMVYDKYANSLEMTKMMHMEGNEYFAKKYMYLMMHKKHTSMLLTKSQKKKLMKMMMTEKEMKMNMNK